jgi:hypothetical protein
MNMADNGVPFVLVGTVTSWDPVTRALHVGDQPCRVPASVPVPNISPNVSVTIAGHRPAAGSEPWTVEEIRLQRGF